MDKVRLSIDEQLVEVEKGSTILEAAREAGIEIPTLCYHPELTLHGSCRVCVVENLDSGKLLASCVTPVQEGMNISTRSTRARRARRRNVVLLLANHPNDCLGCDRNGSCELQDIVHNLGIRSDDVGKYAGEKRDLARDETGPALKRDPNKCILCGRCVRACEEIQGISALQFSKRGFDSIVTTAFDLPQSEINCANCGQCATVCPVGAITEVSEIKKVWKALEDEELHVVVQTAPSIQATIGEEFGMEPGTVVTGRMVSALQKLGFDRIFSTEFSADLTIIEEGYEFIDKIKNGEKLPHITSCCPGWIKYAEHNYPELLELISTAKSPQQMFSALAKTYYAEKSRIDPEKVFTVSVMPCTAKKFEKNREELNVNGFADTDAVLTTRELARMIKEIGVKLEELPEEEFDEMMGKSTGAGTIFGSTGGVTEAALRTVKEKLTGEPLERLNLGIMGIKEASIEVGEETINIAMVSGLKNAARILDQVKKGESKYQWIEIMACPHGCVGGGGQPLPVDNKKKDQRARGLASIDKHKYVRKSHENPMITRLYQEYLGEPLGDKAHHLLHTGYRARPRN